MTKIYKKRTKSLKNQTNYINNNRSLVNINELNFQLENAFWTGLALGVIGASFIALCLTNNKSDKKEINH